MIGLAGRKLSPAGAARWLLEPIRGLRAGRLPVLISAAATIGLAFVPGLLPWASRYPAEWVLPLDRGLTAIINWLLRKASFGLFTVKDVTRAFGLLLDGPTQFLKGLLATGFNIHLGDAVTITLPPISWVGVTAIFVAMALAMKDRRLALIAGGSFLYAAAFGLWESTMETFATIIVAVVVGVAAGVLLGIAAHRWRWIDRVVTPVLDFMQTVPVFAYLVPTLMLFGYGPAGALVITLIYAMPPMARVTTNALAQTNAEIVELGRMVGCSRRQLLWRVLLPSARARLMVGVNQVIMLTLNMVIIASMIGAGGLGYNVWQALKSLRIGQGAEAGIAITLLAIVLDRLSQRYASRRPMHLDRGRPAARRYGLLLGGIAIAVFATLAGLVLPVFAHYPAVATLTTGRFWDNIVDWVNINLFVYISAVRDFLFIYLLRPTKDFLLALPWLGVVALLGAVGNALGGLRLGALVAALAAFIAIVGLWEQAMTSVYLVGICVLIAAVLGIPIGIAAAANDRLHGILQVVLDTLQTLPTFVYLIPVIMLFSVGDFSAMIAVVLYAIVPAIRYTDNAIRQVPAHVVEAGRAFGCSRRQLLRRIIFPLALPDIVLGLNQTLMLGISMLVITALVGTRDLGQETLIALSKVDPGRGMFAGICVAFIAIIADRLMRAWIAKRRKELGLDAVRA
jgi:glycine betaine/proline transport system permease protein